MTNPINKKYPCTQCGGDAYIAWANDKKKNIDCFGAILKPGERLCLTCGRKRGVNFSFQKQRVK